MACTKGEKGRNMGETNNALRKEIKGDIIEKIKDINDIRRTADSIYTSDNFHLDSKEINNGSYKVEIQYKKGTKQTVSVIEVEKSATSTADVKQALTNSLNDGYKWIVS
ncbi:hypothetical protein FC756_09455 [Lysinibacillus mangiferihumi]|uniref:Uncharacterized protein n=1 Tax=Lysinibacillus mangiferihumi TaxID=1130819 RepID=A0A4U2Z5T6_9BACI|nr:hypothetical protein [Lysinibacillus mangiferihumi]TKI69185.1 hypothetical protein FC756_09455 [Lysinibacillus mangiferihumi]